MCFGAALDRRGRQSEQGRGSQSWRRRSAKLDFKLLWGPAAEKDCETDGWQMFGGKMFNSDDFDDLCDAELLFQAARRFDRFRGWKDHRSLRWLRGSPKRRDPLFDVSREAQKEADGSQQQPALRQVVSPKHTE